MTLHYANAMLCAHIHESISMYECVYLMYVCLLADMLWAYICACMYRHTYVGMKAYIYTVCREIYINMLS